MLRSLAEACCTPEEVLTKLNRLMLADFPAGKFVTMIYGVFDPAKRSLTFASAGHLPPLLVDGDCSRFVQTEKGIPLGLGRGGFSEVVVDLSRGSRLVLYSDGITEATGPTDQEYSPERLQEGLEWAWRQSYSLRSIATRITGAPWSILPLWVR